MNGKTKVVIGVIVSALIALAGAFGIDVHVEQARHGCDCEQELKTLRDELSDLWMKVYDLHVRPPEDYKPPGE